MAVACRLRRNAMSKFSQIKSNHIKLNPAIHSCCTKPRPMFPTSTVLTPKFQLPTFYRSNTLLVCPNGHTSHAPTSHTSYQRPKFPTLNVLRPTFPRRKLPKSRLPLESNDPKSHAPTSHASTSLVSTCFCCVVCFENVPQLTEEVLRSFGQALKESVQRGETGDVTITPTTPQQSTKSTGKSNGGVVDGAGTGAKSERRTPTLTAPSRP